MCSYAHWLADLKPVEVPTKTVERPKTPEPKTETKAAVSELIPEALEPTEDLKATPTPATPARKPARVVPFGGPDLTKADISRLVTPRVTTGTPPPVPKRAAARGTLRPGSTLITLDILKSQPAKGERRVIGKVGDEGGEKKEEARVEVEAEGEPKAVAEKTEGTIGVVPVTTEEAKEEPKVEAGASAPDSALQETLAVPEVATNTATPNTPINSPSPLPEYTQEPTTEAPATITATGSTTADQASILSASSASVYTKYTKDVLPSIPATTTTEEDLAEDDEWVGNTRWEDRAWNEIIRIREEMFWARVGGGTVGDGDAGVD